MRRASCSWSVTGAPPVTISTTGSVIPGGGEGHVEMVGRVGLELLVIGGVLEVGGGVEGGVCVL